METLGSRRMARPITMALSPSYKVLAAATAAGGEGDCSAWGSRVDILRLWRDEKDPEKGRRLQILASIPDCDGDLHRLAWSRPLVHDWKYPLGLLAGGLGSGDVCIWNPAKLSYEPGVRTIDGDDDRFFSLGVCARGIICDSSKMPYVSYNDRAKTELAKPKVDKEVEETVLDMSREVETLYMNQDDGCEEDEDWELVSKDQIEDVCKDTLISQKARGFVLRMSGFTGPVRGLAFNNQYGNMLAASAQGDKLNVYYIDCPVKESTSTYEFVDTSEKAKNAQTTFLEWHPQYPAILASTSDIGTTIWDIRKKIPASIRLPRNEYCSEVHWQPNNVVCLATASNGSQSSDPVKIWDLKCSIEATHTFGPKRGVNSLSWSPDDLILTTDRDGGVTCWKLNDKSADPCAHTTAAGSEVRWCESEGAFVVYSTDGVGLYKLLKC